MNMLKFIRVRVYIGKMEALKRYLDEKYTVISDGCFFVDHF